MPNARYLRSDALIDAETGDRLMMMNVETGDAYDLNPSARLLWEALMVPCTVDELCQLLQSRYEIDEEDCREAVSAVLADMLAAGVIERLPGVQVQK